VTVDNLFIIPPFYWMIRAVMNIKQYLRILSMLIKTN